MLCVYRWSVGRPHHAVLCAWLPKLVLSYTTTRPDHMVDRFQRDGDEAVTPAVEGAPGRRGVG